MKGRVITEVGLLTTASFIQGAGFSLIAPFYPNEAFERENTPTHVGIVMGVYQLVMFVSSPLFGWALSHQRIQPRSLLWIGLLMDGFFSAAFGFVVFLRQSFIFFGTSLVLRTMQSLEAAFSAGLIAGPFFGGLLFHYLGFCATFLIFGGSLALLGIMCRYLFPTSSNSGSWKNLSLWIILQKPRVTGNSLLFFIGLMMIGFNDATLSVHLQQFNLSPAWMGIMFIPCALTQSIFSPLWGLLASSLERPRLVCVAGTFFCAVAFSVSGLSSFYYETMFSSSIVPTIIAQFFLGVGVGAIYIPAFLDALRYCLTKLHYPDDVGTYGLLSGLLTCALCLGSSIGSAAGGVLLDHYTYSIACQFMLVIVVATMAVLIATPGSPLPTITPERETDILIKSVS
ncbi:MFS-type transporter SLC18B1-like isoform X2 [Varroa jacobsoni]|uniref:MFS-type transporter SLC18B1-like isoform X2 n=1 Tax=Varroa jacobsoni TaxID=62625 RepID=UPI000BF45E32|nr:MFS-type transporter SLC18B1-like isoform X2 [Varroa jacobsoni]